MLEPCVPLQRYDYFEVINVQKTTFYFYIKKKSNVFFRLILLIGENGRIIIEEFLSF